MLPPISRRAEKREPKGDTREARGGRDREADTETERRRSCGTDAIMENFKRPWKPGCTVIVLGRSALKTMAAFAFRCQRISSQRQRTTQTMSKQGYRSI